MLLTAWLGGNAYAVKVASLYQAELPVPSQSEDEKNKAIKTGLMQVLVKVSGDPKIKVNLEKPESYVQEFAYVATPDLAHPYVIQIRYSPADVDELVKKANTTHWGENRPLLMLWLALTNQQQSTVIVGNETGGSLVANVKQLSGQYGLPMVLPVMDVADASQVLPQDVLQMELLTLKEAGKRYAAEAFLIGKIQQNNTDFQSQWRLALSDAQWDWSFTGKTPEAIVNQALDRVSQTLAKHYLAAPETTDRPIILIVNNVNQPADLNQLLAYLKQMPSVKQMQLMQISGGAVQLGMQVHGTLETFEKEAAVGQHLVLKSQAGEDKLLYEWTR